MCDERELERRNSEGDSDSLNDVGQKFQDLLAKLLQQPPKPKHNLFGSSSKAGHRLRPSMIDRAVSKPKFPVSSTPMYCNKKLIFSSDDELVSPIDTSSTKKQNVMSKTHSVISLSSAISSPENNNNNEKTPEKDILKQKKKNLDHIVSRLSKSSDHIRQKSTGKSSKLVQTSNPNKSLPLERKLARNIRAPIERQTQTGESLKKVSQNSDHLTTQCLSQLEKQKLLTSFKNKEWSSDSSVYSSESGKPWRVASELKSFGIPMGNTRVHTEEDDISDDTFLPKPLPKKKVFENKRRTNKVNNVDAENDESEEEAPRKVRSPKKNTIVDYSLKEGNIKNKKNNETHKRIKSPRKRVIDNCALEEEQTISDGDNDPLEENNVTHRSAKSPRKRTIENGSLEPEHTARKRDDVFLDEEPTKSNKDNSTYRGIKSPKKRIIDNGPLEEKPTKSYKKNETCIRTKSPKKRIIVDDPLDEEQTSNRDDVFLDEERTKSNRDNTTYNRIKSPKKRIIVDDPLDEEQTKNNTNENNKEQNRTMSTKSPKKKITVDNRLDKKHTTNRDDVSLDEEPTKSNRDNTTYNRIKSPKKRIIDNGPLEEKPTKSYKKNETCVRTKSPKKRIIVDDPLDEEQTENSTNENNKEQNRTMSSKKRNLTSSLVNEKKVNGSLVHSQVDDNYQGSKIQQFLTLFKELGIDKSKLRYILNENCSPPNLRQDSGDKNGETSTLVNQDQLIPSPGKESHKGKSPRKSKSVAREGENEREVDEQPLGVQEDRVLRTNERSLRGDRTRKNNETSDGPVDKNKENDLKSNRKKESKQAKERTMVNEESIYMEGTNLRKNATNEDSSELHTSRRVTRANKDKNEVTQCFVHVEPLKIVPEPDKPSPKRSRRIQRTTVIDETLEGSTVIPDQESNLGPKEKSTKPSSKSKRIKGNTVHSESTVQPNPTEARYQETFNRIDESRKNIAIEENVGFKESTFLPSQDKEFETNKKLPNLSPSKQGKRKKSNKNQSKDNAQENFTETLNTPISSEENETVNNFLKPPDNQKGPNKLRKSRRKKQVENSIQSTAGEEPSGSAKNTIVRRSTRERKPPPPSFLTGYFVCDSIKSFKKIMGSLPSETQVCRDVNTINSSKRSLNLRPQSILHKVSTISPVREIEEVCGDPQPSGSGISKKKQLVTSGKISKKTKQNNIKKTLDNLKNVSETNSIHQKNNRSSSTSLEEVVADEDFLVKDGVGTVTTLYEANGVFSGGFIKIWPGVCKPRLVSEGYTMILLVIEGLVEADVQNRTGLYAKHQSFCVLEGHSYLIRNMSDKNHALLHFSSMKC